MKQHGAITPRKRKDGGSYHIAWCAADCVHADASVGLRTYAHAMPSQQAEAAQVMDTVFIGGI
jgi:hypothetical protein